jgi:hypothetical protein
VEFDVPVGVDRVMVSLPSLGISVPVMVGHLDPPETHSGLVQRLRNLGFLSGMQPEQDDIAHAVATFQATRGLSATGVVDDATRRALAEHHGI